jgi:hypothetical protein
VQLREERREKKEERRKKREERREKKEERRKKTEEESRAPNGVQTFFLRLLFPLFSLLSFENFRFACCSRGVGLL